MNNDHYETRRKLIIELSNRNDWSIIQEEVNEIVEKQKVIISIQDILELKNLYEKFVDKEYELSCEISGKLILVASNPHLTLNSCSFRIEKFKTNSEWNRNNVHTPKKADVTELWGFETGDIVDLNHIPDLKNFKEKLNFLCQKYSLEDYEVIAQLNKYIEGCKIDSDIIRTRF